MNVVEGLQSIRTRLVENDADPQTLSVVNVFLERAAHPKAQNASATSQLQLVRLLLRTPAADANVQVYNDLARLEEEMEGAASVAQARREEEEAKPVPKLKKYYKQQKAKEKQQKDA